MKNSDGLPENPPPPSSDGEAFLRAYTGIMEMLVKSEPLVEILGRIARLVCELSPVETWCAIARISGDPPQLKLAASHKIPAKFIESLRELHMSPDEGTCGKAIQTRRTVIVEDILGYPAYAKFHELSRSSGIRASWTVPVLGETGEVVAAITIFYQEARSPGEEEVRRVEDLRHLVSLAIEKSVAAESLSQSNRRFRSAASATNDAIWDWNIADGTVWWCENFAELFGHQGPGRGPDIEGWFNRIHPEDRDRIREGLAKSSADSTSHWNGEYRFQRADGSYAHIRDQAEIIRGLSGEVVRMVGGMTDISSKKAAEKELGDLNRSLEMLRACNQVLARAADEKQLLTDVCKIAVEVGGYELAWVGYAGTGSGKPIIPQARFGERGDYCEEIRLSYSAEVPEGRGPGGQTVRSGKAVICEDILNEEPTFAWKKQALGRGFRSLVCLPLRDENGCFGFLSLLSEEVNAVGKDEEKLLQELADNLAYGVLAIRDRVREETTRDAIVKVAQTISDGAGPDFYQRITANMVEALNADGALIGRVEDVTKSVTSLSFFFNGAHQQNVSYPLRETPCENAISKDICIFPEKIQKLFPEDHALIEMEIEAYAGIALFNKDGKRSGILSVLFKRKIDDPALVEHILKIFAERAASEMERHDANARIHEQASLLDKARDAIFTYDLRHGIQFWNESAKRLYGYTKEEAVGKDVRTLLHDNTGGYDTAHAHTLRHGEWMGELNQVNREGKTLIVESRWSLLRDPDDNPISILTINTDVTGHRYLERQFLRAQRLESIGTLAGGLAHDLNNVLTPISMSIELLRSNVKDERTNELLDMISRSATRGADMVAQILSFARGVEGRRVRVTGNEIIQEITSIIRDTFPKSIFTETSLDPDLWPVSGDPTQLHQVLLNLCVNARDAMPDGGRIFISASNKMIDEKYVSKHIDARKGPYVCISVEDTGKGIPPDIMGRIYDPFFTTKEIGKGTGLGLSTTLTIIRSHGGFINSYSELGTGTGFRVYLPAVEGDQDQQPSKPPVESLPSGDGETILLIDDEEDILAMTARTLRSYGYRTITAATGEQGVSNYRKRQHEIDLTITDMMMSGMNGPETVDRILEIDPKARFIAVSGIRTNENIIRKGRECVVGFLQKPYMAESLLRAIASGLRQKHK